MKSINTRSAAEIAADLINTFQQANFFTQMDYADQRFIVPVHLSKQDHLSDLLEISEHKQAVLENFSAFLNNKPYNHILLWGARGTGKSTLIRATWQHFAKDGLKLLQVSCDNLADLAFLIWVIGKMQEKFVIFIDDLSFSQNDDSYRALKAVLDGSVSTINDNTILCVTSNRRHLISEKFSDDRALHPDEDTEEQISLSDRFGLRLSFHPLSQEQYILIVKHYLKKIQKDITDELLQKSLQFSLARGSRSARIAKQFAYSLN